MHANNLSTVNSVGGYFSKLPQKTESIIAMARRALHRQRREETVLLL